MLVYNLDFSIPQPFLLPGNLEIQFFLPLALEEQVPFFEVPEVFGRHDFVYVQGKKGCYNSKEKDKSINSCTKLMEGF